MTKEFEIGFDLLWTDYGRSGNSLQIEDVIEAASGAFFVGDAPCRLHGRLRVSGLRLQPHQKVIATFKIEDSEQG